LDYDRILAEFSGAAEHGRRRWWDYLIVTVAAGIFVWLAKWTSIPPIAMNFYWLSVLVIVLVISISVCTRALWRTTNLS
jgi:hypothetical protein